MKAFLTIFMFSMVIGSTTQAQDWANLKRFEAENAVLAAGPAAQGRVVFMGDSITEGWSDLYPEFFEGKPYVNRGISGQTTAQMLIRFRQDVIRLRPSFVVILAGTNDIAENQGPTSLEAITDNIASMAELAHANGISVVIASVLPASEYPWRPGLKPDVKIPALNQMLRTYAQGKGFIFLDYFSRMTDGKNGLQAPLTTDGVHLSKKGYEVMSKLVASVLE